MSAQHNVWVTKCLGDTMSGCQNVSATQCLGVKMFVCQIVKVSKCWGVKMSRLQNVGCWDVREPLWWTILLYLNIILWKNLYDEKFSKTAFRTFVSCQTRNARCRPLVFRFSCVATCKATEQLLAVIGSRLWWSALLLDVAKRRWSWTMSLGYEVSNVTYIDWW